MRPRSGLILHSSEKLIRFFGVLGFCIERWTERLSSSNRVLNVFRANGIHWKYGMNDTFIEFPVRWRGPESGPETRPSPRYTASQIRVIFTRSSKESCWDSLIFCRILPRFKDAVISPGTLNYSGSSEFCFASVAFQGTQAKAVQLLFRRRQVGPRKRWQAGVKESDMQRSCHACVCFALLKNFGSIWIHLVCFSVWFLLIAQSSIGNVWRPWLRSTVLLLELRLRNTHRTTSPQCSTGEASEKIKARIQSCLASRAGNGRCRWPGVGLECSADVS